MSYRLDKKGSTVKRFWALKPTVGSLLLEAPIQNAKTTVNCIGIVYSDSASDYFGAKTLLLNIPISPMGFVPSPICAVGAVRRRLKIKVRHITISSLRHENAGFKRKVLKRTIRRGSRIRPSRQHQYAIKCETPRESRSGPLKAQKQLTLYIT